MIVPGIDAQFQANLVDLQNFSRYDKGYKYWVVRLKPKQGQELVKSFQKILSSSRKPIKLQTDQGTEFWDRLFQKLLREKNTDFFTVNSELKTSVVERFNRTFKNKMYKYLTVKNTLTYIGVVPQLVNSYNNTYHLSIEMNEAKVWDILYGSKWRIWPKWQKWRLIAEIAKQ